MKLKQKHYQRILKILFQILIFTIFIYAFFKIFNQIPSSNIIRLTFILVYVWFTIGINVNLIYPLVKILDEKIKQ